MDDNCTVYKTADFVGKKWTLPILLEIDKSGGAKRYQEIKKAMLDITPKILSSRLKELEVEGLIKKKVDSSVRPIKCEYFLTESGKDFVKIIQQMKKWALKWKYDNKVCENLNCKKCKL